MSDLWKNVNVLDSLIRDVEKIDSKLLNGQEVLAYRDLGRVLANLKREKERLIKEAQVQVEENSGETEETQNGAEKQEDGK